MKRQELGLVGLAGDDTIITTYLLEEATTTF
jgi:hypothetical protein